MSKIAKLLEPLDGAARSRVLGWAISALDVRDLQRPGSGLSGSLQDSVGGQPAGNSIRVQPRFSIGVEEWLSDEQDYGGCAAGSS